MTSKFSEGVLEAVEWQQQRQKWQCYKTRPCSSICSSDATTCMQSFKLRGRRVHISPLNYPKCAQILGVCTHLNFVILFKLYIVCLFLPFFFFFHIILARKLYCCNFVPAEKGVFIKSVCMFEKYFDINPEYLNK